MGQWGKVRKVGEKVFMSHVDTGAFEPITGASIIDDIFILKNGGEEEAAQKELKALKQKYIGKPYNLW
jgi:hypothetical protein